ncbi:MAG: copper resistance protein CopC [Meiothermus sp.]|nr:copper resistance protein CopC [Meiothermus sp.]
MKPIVLSLAALIGGLALAHAGMVSSSPAQDAVLRAMPSQVTLNMQEPVELRLSTFKVYPLAATAADLSSFRRLNSLADGLVRRVLRARNDQTERADSGLQTTGRSAKQVVIGLKSGLKAGAYVVMWQVLSTDSHRTTGFYVFVYKP